MRIKADEEIQKQEEAHNKERCWTYLKKKARLIRSFNWQCLKTKDSKEKASWLGKRRALSAKTYWAQFEMERQNLEVKDQDSKANQ